MQRCDLTEKAPSLNLDHGHAICSRDSLYRSRVHHPDSYLSLGRWHASRSQFEDQSSRRILPDAVKPCELALPISKADPIVFVPVRSSICSRIYTQRNRLLARLHCILPRRSHRNDDSCAHVERNRGEIHFACDLRAALNLLIAPEVPPCPCGKICLPPRRTWFKHGSN